MFASISDTAETQDTATFSKHQSHSSLRKSCHFCRTRKIRCSGQNICGACRERNIECSYEKEGAKGRPKGSTVKSTSQGLCQRSREEAPESATNISEPMATVLSNASLPKEPLPSVSNAQVWSSTTGPPHGQENCTENTITAELQHMFNRLFINHENAGTQTFQDAVMAFNHRNADNDDASDELSGPPVWPVAYEELFFELAQDLVEMVVLRFGSLGCHQSSASHTRYLVTCLTYDKTTSMFDPVVECASPLLQYDKNQIIQMIDIWFSHHPLCFVLSKTLLLRMVRNDAHDEILLTVILADVKCAQEDDKSQAEGEEMFKWATSRLHNRLKECVSLSIVQALTLLGWHELCTGRARRAMCYFGWGKCNIPKLPAPSPGLNQINGIDVGEVELELGCNVHWFTFSITVWALMQIDSPISKLIPLDAPAIFSPVDESSSLVFKLDKISCNLSTLSNQARICRELWPLSHVASTTAHIYALYPQKQDVHISSQLPFCWQSCMLRQLRHLSFLRQDISLLCAEIRLVLTSALELVENNVQNRLSQALVLSAYHTIFIHFLFPRPEDGAVPVPTTDRLVDDFCGSARALLNVLSVLNQPLDSGRVIMGSQPSSVADVFPSGLDACGRALNYLHYRRQLGSDAERRSISERADELLKLATELHTFSQHMKLLPATRSRMVKKQLKLAMRNLSGHRHECDPFSNPNASMVLESDALLGVRSSTDSFFNPYSSTSPNKTYKNIITPYGAGSEKTGTNHFPSSGNGSKQTLSLELELFEENAPLDGMSLDEPSSSTGQFDFDFASTAMDFGNNCGGNHEKADPREWMDYSSIIVDKQLSEGTHQHQSRLR